MWEPFRIICIPTAINYVWYVSANKFVNDEILVNMLLLSNYFPQTN